MRFLGTSHTRQLRAFSVIIACSNTTTDRVQGEFNTKRIDVSSDLVLNEDQCRPYSEQQIRYYHSGRKSFAVTSCTGCGPCQQVSLQTTTWSQYSGWGFHIRPVSRRHIRRIRIRMSSPLVVDLAPRIRKVGRRWFHASSYRKPFCTGRYNTSRGVGWCNYGSH